MDNISKAIAANIKAFRDKQEWSQEDLAKRMSIARPTISKWERGESEPSASQLAQLAEIFNISTEVLLGNIGKSIQRIVVVDTSVLIKTPVIVEDLIEIFDEVIIPDIVIGEINNNKDRGNSSIKQRAWLAMSNINKLREIHQKKILVKESTFSDKTSNDVRIAQVAIDRARKSIYDKVFMFSDDIFFSLLVYDQTNMEVITSQKFDQMFSDRSDDFDVFETQKFFAAVTTGNIEAIKKYNLKKVDVNKVDSATGFTPLIQAVRTKNKSMLNYLIELRKINLDIKDKQKYRFTALHHACQLKDMEVIKILVDHGADFNMGSDGENQGNTPLMVCAWGGFIDGVKYLLDQNACVNQQDNNGYTALHKACIKNHFHIAKMLLPKTDLLIRDRKNNTAEKCINTQDKKNFELIELFKKSAVVR